MCVRLRTHAHPRAHTHTLACTRTRTVRELSVIIYMYIFIFFYFYFYLFTYYFFFFFTLDDATGLPTDREALASRQCPPQINEQNPDAETSQSIRRESPVVHRKRAPPGTHSTHAPPLPMKAITLLAALACIFKVILFLNEIRFLFV